MNILIVEDDYMIAKSISMALEDEGHHYHIANTAEDGMNAVREGMYDAVILDINLPDGDGFQFAKTMRRGQIDTSVLVVSGRASVTDRVVALRSGADGYLTKPFDRQELIASLTAIVRRANGHSDSRIITGPIIVDLAKHEVMIGKKRLNLTSKEYHILELLSLRKGSTLTKSHFINHLYGGIDEPESKIIDVFICKLRKKLADMTGGDNYIHTVWGQGYVLRDSASN
ncbi:MAG: response regulator transcription factor [Alphaproteobacteria bacterium]|nr:response regulator transcription factor [Alphaproteobacteria bacterium]